MGLNAVEETWVTHMGLHPEPFPREVCTDANPAVFERVVVSNTAEYIETVYKLAQCGNVWVSTQSTSQWESGEWDKVYIDIDSTSMTTAHEHMKLFVAGIRRDYGVTPRVYVTGKKGYALYIDFEPTIMDYRKIKKWAWQKSREYGVDIDHKVVGDKRRISRVPYTHHYGTLTESGINMCIPVNPDGTLEDHRRAMKYGAYYGVSYAPCNDLANEINSMTINDTVRADRPTPTKMVNIETLADITNTLGGARKRIMHEIIVPHCVAMGNDVDTCVDLAIEYLQRTGTVDREYQNYAKRSVRWHMNTPDYRIRSIEDILREDPELLNNL